jgi:phosphoribosylformylglycinamidine cyclo-ligase
MASYKESGVDIGEGDLLVEKILKFTRKTKTDGVVNDIGSFGALFKVLGYQNAVLVSGADGVGTKISLAIKFGRYDTVGIDCVAMCANDVLCHGAKPLFFLDYLACDHLDSNIAAELIESVATGCLLAGCALIGGETAEMPGVYAKGEYDLAGFCVGVVEEKNIVDGKKIKTGDVLIGIASSGVHSNGFSLVRNVIENYNVELEGKSLKDILMEPTKIYVPVVLDLMDRYEIKGMAHITGGGLYENIPRMLPDQTVSFKVNEKSYPIPPIFTYLRSLGISEKEMIRTFNMGIGFTLCVSREQSYSVLETLNGSGWPSFLIGEVI